MICNVDDFPQLLTESNNITELFKQLSSRNIYKLDVEQINNVICN